MLAGERGRYSKGTRIFNEIAAARGRGLLTSEGERWQHQRRLIQLFTRRAVAGYATLMAEEASAAAARWAPGATVAAKVDAHAEMTRLTPRVGRTRNLRRRRRRHPRRYALRLSLGDLLGVRRGMSPAAPPPAWPTSANVRGRRGQRELYAVIDRLIARREAAGARGDNLLSRLLSARDPDTVAAMDDQHICDEALIFLLAGHETTSIALTFALDLLARHPRELEQIHASTASSTAGFRPPQCARAGVLRGGDQGGDTPVSAGAELGRLAEAEDEIGG
jgi:cytochrome P450